jgi:hypothetical protein
MHGITVGKRRAALIGDIADWVVAIGAVLLRLVGAEVPLPLVSRFRSS